MKKNKIISFILLFLLLTTTPILTVFASTITDHFDNETYISSYDQLVISGSQVYLDTYSVLYDSYTTGDFDYELRREHPSADAVASAVGQSFTATETFVLRSVSFYAKKVGAPTGTGYARLYEATGIPGGNGKPTGVALASSDGFDVSTLGVGYAVINFSFLNDPYELQNGEDYCVVFENPTVGNIDDSNHPTFYVHYTSPTHAGNFCAWWSSIWQERGTRDTYFYIYKSEYYDDGILYSENLLQSINVTEIESFGYESDIIGSETIDFQFSQDNSTWYNSTYLGAWEIGVDGVNIVNLGVLDWDGGFFYYRANFTDGSTPELEYINVNYSTSTPFSAVGSLGFIFAIVGIALIFLLTGKKGRL